MNYFYSILLFVLVLALSRFIGLPPNVTPLLALAVFVPRMNVTAWLPVVILAVTDIVLGFYTVMPIVYACMLIAAYLGARMSNLYAAGAAGVLMWHIIVNTAVVLTGPGYGPFTPESVIFDLRLLASTLMFLAVFDAACRLLPQPTTQLNQSL